MTSPQMSVGSLFAGIGGWDLGLERTGGFHTQWFCELDPFCRSILAQHWPGVPRFVDITRIGVGRDFEPCQVDVLCGGFPCQDISLAGRGAGLAGARSGLWFEYARLIGELRPRYVLVENVAALVARGLPAVLGSLSELGYDAEWGVVSAADAGAPHLRRRLWLVAYPAAGTRRPEAPTLADASGVRCDPWPRRHEGPAFRGERHRQPRRRARWEAEPALDRVAHGVPGSVDRTRALGNALVPQIAEWIGHRILDYEEVAQGVTSVAA